MKLRAPTLVVLLLLTPAAAMALYPTPNPVPCSLDLGPVPATTQEHCSCNNVTSMLSATFAQVPTSRAVESGCSGQGAPCTITYQGSQTTPAATTPTATTPAGTIPAATTPAATTPAATTPAATTPAAGGVNTSPSSRDSKGKGTGVQGTSLKAPSKPSFVNSHFGAGADDPADLSPERRAYLTDHWTRVLEPVAAIEGRPLFFDVNLAGPAGVLTVATSAGARTMKLLAALTHRHWQQIHGVQVFTRTTAADPSSAPFFEHRVLDWMRSLSPEDRQALEKGQLRLDQVDPAFRDNVVSWAINLQPAMASVLLNRGGRAGIEVGFNPDVSWKDPRTGESQTTAILTTYPPIDVPSDAGPPASAESGGAAADLLEPSLPGALDFGRGRVLELKEILARATSVFGVRYDSDMRLNHATFFVSGKFRRDVFNDVLQAATALQPAGESKTPHGWLGEQAIRDAIGSGYQDLLHDPLIYSPDGKSPGTPLAVSMSAFLNGDDMTVQQLAGASPALMAHFATLGLGPGSIVHLRPALVFMIDGGGVQAGSSID